MKDKKILDTARNTSLNNALASGSAMVSESISGCSSRRNIETNYHSVIPQRFRGVLPQLLPCGISKNQSLYSKHKRKEFFYDL